MTPDLSRFDNSSYDPGRSHVVLAFWFFAGAPLVRSRWLPFSRLRVFVLRLFGARVGRGVVVKPGVRVKYPWLLSVGDHSWIGEDAWIDNLATVAIGRSACISQAAYLCTGNHDWSDPAFGLIVQPISIGDGAWVGARAVLAPGVSLGEGAVAAMGSVVLRNIPAQEIHSGNPARLIRYREIHDAILAD